MTPRLLVMSLLALSACAGTNASRTTSAAPRVRREAPTIRDARQKEEYRAALAAAARRGATEPIEIVVCGAAIPEEVSRALDAGAAVQAIARELWDEPLFRVRIVNAGTVDSRHGIESCVETASARGFVPHVWVSASAEKDDPTERIRRTGNLLAGDTLTIKLEVASAQGTGRAAPSASGPFSDALLVVRDAAREARAAILDEIAPDLPSHAAASFGIGEPDAHETATTSFGGELASR